MRPITFIAALVVVLALAPAAGAHHEVDWPDEMPTLPSVPATMGDDTDEHSENMRLIGNWTPDDHDYREGSDLAFWGDLAVLGNYADPGGFYLLDVSEPEEPEFVGQFECPGPQADVSVWRDLVFVSVDTPQAADACGSGGASTTDTATGGHWEGIRIVSIADPSQPQQIAAVDTDCGSHTHTLVPDLDHRDDDGRRDPRVLLYVSSYPLGGQGVECNVATHRKISIVEVPLKRPEQAQVIATPDVSPAIGCHDITVLMEEDLAAAACISESQIWDISDPADPQILSHIRNPAMEIHHSSAFSWDGEVIVIGDEMGGAAAAAGCLTHGHAPTGSLWFYDVSDPSAPRPIDYYTIPENEETLFCTAHNFNVVPLRSDHRVLTTAWYNGGTHVLDFTDPSNVERIGFYTPKEPVPAAAWSSYWYNGKIYANNFDASYVPPDPRSRGFDVFEIDHPILHPSNLVRVPRLNPQTQEALGPPATKDGPNDRADRRAKDRDEDRGTGKRKDGRSLRGRVL